MSEDIVRAEKSMMYDHFDNGYGQSKTRKKERQTINMCECFGMHFSNWNEECARKGKKI